MSKKSIAVFIILFNLLFFEAVLSFKLIHNDMIIHSNPFFPDSSENGTVEISGTLDWKKGNVSLIIYDLKGRSVRTLLSAHPVNAAFSAQWDGRDDFDRAVPAGIYIFILTGIEAEAGIKVNLKQTIIVGIK